MGLQIVSAIPAFLRFVATHWMTFSIIALIVLVGAALELAWVRRRRPTETAGNGITIGKAKAFDNRSLTLRVERLNAGLESLKVVNQNLTENLSTFQEQTSSEESQSLYLSSKGSGAQHGQDKDARRESNGEQQVRSATTSDALKSDFKPAMGLAASDVLSDRLNLASQIFNLQLLYERSLSDRMIRDQSRLQTVLGFQISITPPSGYEDCAAVAEVAVRMARATPAVVPVAAVGAQPLGSVPAGPPAPTAPITGPVPPAPLAVASPDSSTYVPVSLVALMPQEKTYNAESISSSERSIEGSAVARVLTMGFVGKRGTRRVFSFTATLTPWHSSATRA